MKVRTTTAWVAAFEAAAVPCGPINTIDQMFADPQVLSRGLQIGLTRDDGVQVPGVANPILFSQTPVEYEKAPPKLGDGTSSVLGQVLGLTEAEIAKLKDSGVIG
jgi:crotonobetainyl-CoA:carnitine CoA-transferase CaiB-like acyl-CoA transferase